MITESDTRVWDGMLVHLRHQHPTICRQWFEELEPLGISGGALNLRAHSMLHRDYLRRQCADAFNDALRSVSGQLLAVRFLGPEEEATSRGRSGGRRVGEHGAVLPAFSGAVPRESVPMGAGRDAGMLVVERPRVMEVVAPPRERGAHELDINPDFSFENFVMGPGNRLAHAAAKAVATNPGRAYNPFFIHGGVGLGKTHLLQAICLELGMTDPSISMAYLSCEGFVTEFIDRVQSGEMSAFRHQFRDVDVLVIDDIHFLAKRDRTQDEFFHTFNSLYQASKQIILSSDAPPEEIPDLEARLVSRFKWGLVAKLEPPCYETRVAIVKTKARLRSMAMPDDVACFVASRFDNNVRELEGAIVKLQILASVEKRPLDLELARAALGDPVPAASAEPTIHAIITAVTEFYSVRVTDMQSKRRQRSVALPRQVCMYLARRLTRMSLEEIGGYFGGRDHTTVMHAIRTVEAKRAPDVEFDLVLRSMEDKVRAQRAV